MWRERARSNDMHTVVKAAIIDHLGKAAAAFFSEVGLCPVLDQVHTVIMYCTVQIELQISILPCRLFSDTKIRKQTCCTRCSLSSGRVSPLIKYSILRSFKKVLCFY